MVMDSREGRSSTNTNLNVSARQSHLRRIRFDEEWDGLRNFGVFRPSVVRRLRMCG